MNLYNKHRLKLFIIVFMVEVIELAVVFGSFTGFINLNIITLLFLSVLPVVLMTYLFITSLIHYLKNR